MEEGAKKGGEGELYGWGWNEGGQLGIYTGASINKATKIQLGSGRIVSLSGGLSHSAYVTDTGYVFTFGKGKYGRLGQGTEKDSLKPQIVTLFALRILHVSCGGYHTLAIDSKGGAYSWGRGSHGQLGLGDTKDRWTPVFITDFKEVKIHHFAAGTLHSLWVSDKNQLFGSGNNENGEVGVDSKYSSVIQSPLRIDTNILLGIHIQSIAAGNAFSALVGNGQLFTWGKNDKGQLGLGHSKPQSPIIPSSSSSSSSSSPGFLPEIVEGLKGVNIVQVSCGNSHSCCVSEQGHLYSWGSGEHGNLGYGTLGELITNQNQCQLSPRRVKEALYKETVEEVACGGYHVMARTSGGWKLYSWGLGDYGQLGISMTSLSNHISAPQRLRGIFEEKRIAKMSCGGRHSLVATDFPPNISFTDSTYKIDFCSLQKDSSFIDITLEIGSEKRPCHKVILSRAKKWKAIFSQDPKISCLTLSDLMSVKVADLLLHYLYKDELPNWKVSKEEEKALLLELKKVCETLQVEKLYHNLNFKSSIGIESSSLFEEIPASMSQDFLLLLNSNDQLSDVAFQLDDGDPVYAHKSVLSCRSPHFKGLLGGHFKESQESIIQLPDIKRSVFITLLQYIYTDQVTILDEDAVDLLILANEYSLDRLTNICEEFIERGLDIENAAWVLELADRNNALQLKAFAEYFVIHEFEGVSKTEAFSNLPQDLKTQLGKKIRSANPVNTQNNTKSTGDKGCNLQ